MGNGHVPNEPLPITHRHGYSHQQSNYLINHGQSHYNDNENENETENGNESQYQPKTQCLCNKFINKTLLDIERHRTVCTYSIFCCRQCFRIYGDRQQLVSHQKKSNHGHNIEYDQKYDDREVYRCDYNGCNESFYHLWRLNKHRKCHNKPYQCTYNGCNKSFGDRRNLMVHSRTHSGQKFEKCQYCDKSFCDPSTLRHHILYLHTNGSQQKPFICRKCRKAFTKRSKLKAHLLSHLPRNDRTLYQCSFNPSECNASFTIKSNLNRHLRKVHGCLN